MLGGLMFAKHTQGMPKRALLLTKQPLREQYG